EEEGAEDELACDRPAAKPRRRRRVVISGDPEPVAPGDEGREAASLGGAQPRCGIAVMEAVTEADDAARTMPREHLFKAVERRRGVVGRQHRAVPRIARRLLEVEVGDDDGFSCRPDERAARVGEKRGRGELERGTRRAGTRMAIGT